MEHGNLLFDAFIYLCAAVISVPIAKRLGLGSVLGYLVAGVLIGPFVLGFVGDQTNVMHFAEFGVVMMLFLVGLELKPSLLWKMRGPIVGTGGLQVLLSTAVITLIAMYLATSFSHRYGLGFIFNGHCITESARKRVDENIRRTERFCCFVIPRYCRHPYVSHFAFIGCYLP
jgi:Kef-type K+ transport system membrane component KefB